MTDGEKTSRILPLCAKEAEKLNIILACDGAASVGQVGHQVAVDLTNAHEDARMCCITAVAAESKAHVDVARHAKKLIIINGCANRCASKVMEKLNIPYSYEIIIAKEGVEKIPTLDFDQADVERIAGKIAAEALEDSNQAAPASPPTGNK
jgi:uncharacterized metal-binding protein